MAKSKKQTSTSQVPLPSLLTIPEIETRLGSIFPPAFPNRSTLVGPMAGRVIFVFLYGGFIEGHGRYLRPSNIYLFTGAQSTKISDEERKAWLAKANTPGFRPVGERWYADTSREPIRDDLMRNELLAMGIMQKLPGYAITSSSPINYLSVEFAALFNPELKDDALIAAIDAWQKKHLNRATLSRMALKAQGLSEKQGDVFIEMPDSTRTRISAGPSSLITKGLIENFARIFLTNPAVLWLSASDKKAYPQYVETSASVGLKFDLSAELPDLILADLTDPIRYVFCEVVASDGPVTEERKKALLEIVASSAIPVETVSFLTAFEDREAAPFRKTFSKIAVDTLIWFRSEPTLLVTMENRPEFDNDKQQ